MLAKFPIMNYQKSGEQVELSGRLGVGSGILNIKLLFFSIF